MTNSDHEAEPASVCPPMVGLPVVTFLQYISASKVLTMYIHDT